MEHFVSKMNKSGRIRVGVTGVGGGVGQSIIKALQMSTLDLDILAIDITHDSAGFYFDNVRTRVLSNLKGLDYPPADWESMVYGNRLDCIIPGSDYDLKALSSVRDEWGAVGCRVLVSDCDLVSICEDKYSTIGKLSVHVDTPELFFPDNDDIKFPLIVKPRVGSGSRGVVKVCNVAELERENKEDSIIQEYLDGPEYTCSVFVDKHGEVIGTFQLKRELNNGTTYKGRVVFERDIHKLLVKIGKVLKPLGMLNVQLRKTDRGPIPFEINCRCSGTTAIRAHFGYNEPELLIRNYVLGENLKTPEIKYGKAFRYWNETYKGE
jgi:carbamoyl-phosphate synthase large subunit